MHLDIKPQPKPFLHWIKLPELFMAAIGSSFIVLAVEGVFSQAIATVVVGVFLGLSILATRTNWLQDSKFNKFLAREGVLPIIGLTVVAALSIYFVIHAEPSHAQFFFNAETKLKSGVTPFVGTDGGAAVANVIGVIFFAYRFAMICYIGAAIIKVVGAMREEEDWKNSARTPGIILISLAIADVATQLILGTA
jgi:uncharacterized BrkB/YihY/UPF0761 family membrane protein